MTKFKKQIILSAVLLVFAIGLAVLYFVLDSGDETVNPAPVLTATLEGDTVKVTGLMADKSYVYSTDAKNGKDIDDNKGFSYKSGKMCYIKEKGDKSDVAAIGPFGESTKNGRPYIVEKIENADMNSIFVHNTLDEYTMIHKMSGAYAINGLEGYDKNEEILAQLRVNTLNMLAVRYVEDADMNALHEYGIDLENPENYFVVAYNDEKDSYKIIVGDKTPDEDGYYAVLEGRDALYVIDTGVEGSVLLPRSGYVKPTVVHTVNENRKFELINFQMNKKGNLFIRIEKATGDLTYGNNSSHKVTYPANNNATSLTNFEQLLNMLLGLQGTSTILYGEGVTPEALIEYGFFDAEGNDISDYSFSYKYPAFSEELYLVKDEEMGDFIAYSSNNNIVARIAPESVAFLDWDMLLWLSAEIFLLDIEDIATVKYEENGKSAEFALSGTGEELAVTVNGKPAIVADFKALYRSIFDVIITSFSEGSDYGGEILRMLITTEKGEELDYRFYSHSAQYSYYTLNGSGEFYVSADKVNNMKETAFGFLE